MTLFTRITNHWSILVISMPLLFAAAAHAQGQPDEGKEVKDVQRMEGAASPNDEGMMTCMCQSMGMEAMQGPMGIVVMTLGGLLLASVIATLIALTIFLLRRSRPPQRPAETS